MATEPKSRKPAVRWKQSGCENGGSRRQSGSRVGEAEDARQSSFDKVQPSVLDLEQATEDVLSQVEAEEEELVQESPPKHLANVRFSEDHGIVDQSTEPVSRGEYDESGCENGSSRRRKGRRVGEPEDARWKRNFFDKVQQRGLNLQQVTVDVLSQVKAEEEKLLQKSPPDPLAREWFSADKETVDTRAYLLEKLLPSLVPGVEKLLKEVEKRQLLDPPGTTSPKFNPVNFLAETLMRNNPQFVGGQKPSAYDRGLKQVVKDLKSQVFDLEFNRLAQLKQEMKAALEKREKLEDIDAQVMAARKQALALQFPEWTLDVSGRIPAAVIQSALKSFQEIASRLPVEPKFVVYSKDLPTEETLDHKLNADEFVEYVHSYIKDLSTDLFLALLHHLSQSANVFRETIRHDRWRQMFTDLFLACDHGKLGVLDRQRVLLLLEAFYDSEGLEDAGWGFRNPRQWPMIEFREMDPTEFWADFDEAPKVILSEGYLTPEESLEGLEVRASGVISGALEHVGSQTDWGMDSVTERHSVERVGSVQEKKSRSDGAVDSIGEKHSASRVGSVQRKKSGSDRAVDLVGEQHSAGRVVSPQGMKSGSDRAVETVGKQHSAGRVGSVQGKKSGSDRAVDLVGEQHSAGRVGSVQGKKSGSDRSVDVVGEQHSAGRVRSVQRKKSGSDRAVDLVGEQHSAGRVVSPQGMKSGSDRAVETVGKQHSAGRVGSVQGKKSGSDRAVDSVGEQHSAGRAVSVEGKKSGSERAVDLVGEKHSAGRVGSVQGKKSGSDRAVDSVGEQHSAGRAVSVEGKKSGSERAVDLVGEKHSAGRVGSAQGMKSGIDRSVDSVGEQHSAGKLGSVEMKKSNNVGLGAAGSAVSSEGKMTVPDHAMPILKENTNTNAGNGDLVADPAQGSPPGSHPPTREASTNVQNIAPGREHSASMQSPSLVMDVQPAGDEQTVVQSAISSTSADRVKDAESFAEEPTVGEEHGATTVTEEKLQKESSLDVTEEAKDSEDQRTGDVGVTKEPQDIDGIPWSGDLLTTDLALKYGSYGNRSLDEWSVAASRYTDLRSIITDIHSWEPPRINSAFDRSSLNLPQFVQLMESFLAEETSLPVVEKLVAFIRNGYMETEERKFKRLEKVRREAFSARRKLVLEALFQKWDMDGSGFIELSELEAVLSKYKEGMESAVLTRGRERLKSAQVCKDEAVKINSRGFQRYIESLMEELPGTPEEVFESLVEFLTASIERTQTERVRGSARRKWLNEIQRAAERSGGSLEPIYQAAFQALYKDAESHGTRKKISASIGLLEQSPPEAERGPHLLRYVACTLEDAPYLLNKSLYRDMKGVSFNAVDEGKPVHVPRVQYHGNIHFWKYDRPLDERTGSFLVLPLKDSRMRIFGTLGIDTIRDPRERNIFLTHEISFYQGVSNTFSEAYHYVQTRRNILQLVSSALAWIHNRAPNIKNVTTYLMEPGTEKLPDYVLRKVMTTDNNTGLSEIHDSPGTLRRKENLFRDYLFKCADSSEVITTDAYGERHIAVPIREPSGRALAVIDVSTGKCRDLPAHEFQDLQKMLQMLQAACSEILEEAEGETEQTFVLEAERTGEESRMGVLFYRFMLQDLRECVQKLDHQSFAELKSYKEPPTMIHNILRAVLLLFHPELAASDEVESWNQCKLKVNTSLVRKITSFDPTASTVQVKPELVAKYIKGIPRGAVWRHGSIPAEYLYNWAFTCLSLLELNPSLLEAQELSAASLTQEPSAASLTQEPSAASLTQEPSAASLTQEPSAASLTQEPSGASLTQKPSAAAPTLKPSAAALTQKPSAAAPTQKPSAAAPTQKPSAAALSQKPSAAAPTQKPSAAALTQKPSAAALTQNPSAAALTQKPSVADPTQKPSAAAPTQKPSAAAPTQKPSAAAPTQKPSAAALSQKPSAAAPTQKPSAAALTQKPSAAAPTQKPSAAALSQKPSAAAPTQKPSAAALTQKPSAAALTQKSSAAALTQEPSTVSLRHSTTAVTEEQAES
ncbi:EF-hand calcium-binding domain-containing protein 5 isoform X1 [Lissotriton helveticus]